MPLPLASSGICCALAVHCLTTKGTSFTACITCSAAVNAKNLRAVICIFGGFSWKHWHAAWQQLSLQVSLQGQPRSGSHRFGLQHIESLVSSEDKAISSAACRVAGGVQARVAADPAFGFKLGCECCLDLAIIMAVNLAHRRDRFLKDIDYVLSQV